MTTVQSSTLPVGCKYASKEEARLANLEKTKQRYYQNKEQVNDYQREQQRTLRDQKKKYEQISSNPLFPLIEQVITNPQLQQQFVNYVNIVNNPYLYQHFINYIESIDPAKLVLSCSATFNQQPFVFQFAVNPNNT